MRPVVEPPLHMLSTVLSINQAEEQRIVCKYCNSTHTHLDYRLHQLSNAHVKKVKVELVQSEFSSVCMVCKLGLKDLKEVEDHVQGRTHRDKMNFHCPEIYTGRNKCNCDKCGVLFYNEVAFDTHWLMPSHKDAAKSYSFSKLNELLRQLSGLPGENLAPNASSLCSICQVQHDSLEAYIMHLFTTSHVSRLRFSSCLVCKKEFVHADNRESHLGSSKHFSNLQKCSDLLEEARRHAAYMKGGYPCMFCMVSCKSWLCLELHVQYTHHANVSNAKRSAITTIKFAISRDNEDGQVDVCNVSAARWWKEWREDGLKENAWCHRCGMSLDNLNEAKKHMENDHLPIVMCKTHAHEAVDYPASPELFSCCVCTLSFKNALLLKAHEASLEHHCRLAKSPTMDDLVCCANCGILMDKDDSDDKSNAGKEFNVAHSDDINKTGHRTEGLQMPSMYPAKNEGNDVSSNAHSDSFEVINKDGCKVNVLKSDALVWQTRSKPVMAEKSTSVTGNVYKMMVSHDSMRDQACLSTHPCRVKRERSPIECRDHGAMNSYAFTGGNRLTIEKDADMMLIGSASCGALDNEGITCKGFKCHSACGKQASSVGLSDGRPAGRNCCTSGAMPGNVVHDKACLIEEKKTSVTDSFHAKEAAKIQTGCGDSPLACTKNVTSVVVEEDPASSDHGKVQKLAIELQNTNMKIPIVAAAVLAPLGSLQQSLQSVMSIVAEALSASLPMYMRHSASSLVVEDMKRERERDETINDRSYAKRMCSEEVLKEALHHSHQTICLNSASVTHVDFERGNSADKVLENPLICCENEGNTKYATMDDKIGKTKAVLTTAASVVEGNESATEKLYVYHIPQPVIQAQEPAIQPTIQAQEKAMKMVSHGNDIVDIVKGDGVKVEELPASTMQVGMPSICIKNEKDDDDDDSFKDLSQFNTDLWWVISDSEDVNDTESNFKLPNK